MYAHDYSYVYVMHVHAHMHMHVQGLASELGGEDKLRSFYHSVRLFAFWIGFPDP